MGSDSNGEREFAPRATRGSFGSDASRTGLLPPAMAGGSVSFALDDGGTLTVLDRDVQHVYEALWGISGEPGAVTTAAYLMSQSRVRPHARLPVELTILQSAALRKAVAGPSG
jgi:hypothetical protein